MSEQEHIDELHDMAVRLHQIAIEYEGKPHCLSLIEAGRKVRNARGHLMEAANAAQARAKRRKGNYHG